MKHLNALSSFWPSQEDPDLVQIRLQFSEVMDQAAENMGESMTDKVSEVTTDNADIANGTNNDKEKIRKLEAQVVQLKNIIVKLTGQKEESDVTKTKKSGRGRPFDFRAHKRRHVLLHLSYAGWNLHGFAVQVLVTQLVIIQAIFWKQN